MKKPIIINNDTKLSDIISFYPFIITQFEHLNINIPVEEKNISDIAKENKINTNFLKFIIEYILNNKIIEQYTPQIDDITILLLYLKNNHDYFIKYMFPHIDKIINKTYDETHQDEILLIKKFFQEYNKEVLEHFEYENQIVFPYITKLYNSIDKKEKITSDYCVEEYKNHHDDIEEKLNDLKNLLIKYLPSTIKSDFRKRLLFNLYQLEKDLDVHSYLEDKILIPLVEKLEAY
ncbi:MAG TPA: hemerythrin domain-containing protein [Ignavibacteriales bacterium]|nr:hemerythrin domain-containing protein [Ignavibacteriales bacterium]HOL80902.1 hemerythrin domain-containing protein [Ignavibacteriales bacterium]HOM64637.1 hemerythrin domain-containing protein [Ignavibacteriales bacterium]HPD66832.1 hemerythrin domain-containing protein [Ignavibacteriales bacterium]HPP32682.1 hemerythrin domain-containing protein [Ignavibacteriales bacterium]